MYTRVIDLLASFLLTRKTFDHRGERTKADTSLLAKPQGVVGNFQTYAALYKSVHLFDVYLELQSQIL